MRGRQKDYLEGAILAVDAVGYSRLMGKDEEATLRRLHSYRGLIQDLATTHGGRVFGVAGDSEMAIFAEAGDAVRCALEIQGAVRERDSLLPKDSQMPVRIGLNYGLVIVEDGSYFGDDVNVTARIESFAEAGEICLSGAVFDRVRDSQDWGFDAFGEERFKNISRSIRVYRVRTDPESLGQVIPAKRRRPKPGRVWRVAAAASLIALLGATGWGVKVQVEKQRAEAEAATVIAEARSSVATAEAEIVELLDDLRDSEKRAAEERGRVEKLLARLQDIRGRAERNEQAALEQADEARDLLTLLQAAEERAEVERRNAQELLAALQEAEDQVTAAREAAEQERLARRDAERRAADQALMESLLASWRVAERQAAEERTRTEALLAALQDAEARAEAERQANLERKRTETLLARLTEAHGLADRESERAEDLYAQIQDARDKVADHNDLAQQLDAEAGRIETLLDTLREAEVRVAAERDRVESILETLRQTEPAPATEVPKGELDGNGAQWQEANSLERAKVLLATWTEAERAATGERARAEDLLAALETISQDVRAPPPVPPFEPETRSFAKEVASEVEGIRPSQRYTRPIAPSGQQIVSTSIAPTDFAALNGTWTGEKDAWSLTLTIEDRQFTLRALCKGGITYLDTVTGRLDDDGLIYKLISGNFYHAIVFGPPNRLEIVPNFNNCGLRTTIELRRDSSEPTLALATEPSFDHFDGRWVGKGVTLTGGTVCSATLAIEILVSGPLFTGNAKATTGTSSNLVRQFSGYVDVSGSIESKRYTPGTNSFRGTLLANSGKGSGEWLFSERCGGTFELTRVE